MFKSCVIVVFCLLGVSCTHRHHANGFASSYFSTAIDSVDDVESAITEPTVVEPSPVVTTPETSPTEVAVIDTNTVVVTSFERDFDEALFEQISAGAIANGDSLPTSEVATFSGHALLAGSIEGTVDLSVNFANRNATGQITDMSYFGDADSAPLSGQLDMSGQTVSRIGLKLDVDGTVTSDLTGTGVISGTLRGVFRGGGPDGFAGYLTSNSTLPVLAGQTMSGPVYAQ